MTQDILIPFAPNATSWVVRFGRIGRHAAHAWWAGPKRGIIEIRLARIQDWATAIYPGLRPNEGFVRATVALICQHEAMHIAMGRDGGSSRQHHYATWKLGIL